MFARALKKLRRAVKQLLPYGVVRAIYSRSSPSRNIVRDILPYAVAKRIWQERRVDFAALARKYDDVARSIASKVRSGAKVRVLFLVTNASIFPAKPLCEAMLQDAFFDVRVLAIPDLRWRFGNPSKAMQDCFAALSTVVAADRLAIAKKDAQGQWQDELSSADIVVFPLPYLDVYDGAFSPRRAAEGEFLPVCVNYGYYRSIYDRTLMADEFYAFMWKAMFECEATLAEYRAVSLTGGDNAVLTGYVKMDALAAVAPVRHSRKRILLALHHSVSNGTNDMLALANIARYEDFFMALPDRYPEIDFVLRPHPFLLKILSSRFLWGERKTERYFAALRAKPNVIWSDGADYLREFAESDACIQDCGSYLVEYFYTKKPCCYMLKSPHDIEEKFAPLGRHCLAHCYIAYDERAIDEFIKHVVMEADDPMMPRREAFAGTVMLNYPHAANVALECIKRTLKP